MELSAGQMIEDVRLAVEGQVKVDFYGRMGGMIPSPDEILDYFEKNVIQEGQAMTEIKVLDPEGLTDVIFFSNSPKGTHPPMVRVYPRDEDDAK